MKSLASMFITVSLLSQPLLPQRLHNDVNVTEIPLVIRGEPTPTEETIGGLFGAIQCDAHGAAYVRSIGGPGSGSPFANPLIRISPDGSVRRYPLRPLPGIGEDYLVRAYSVERDGQMYAIVQSMERTASPEEAPGKTALHLVAFTDDGEFRWQSRFTSEFEPIELVALPNDNFFIAGVRRQRGVSRPSPFFEVVNRNTELVRSLGLEKTPESKVEAKGGAAAVADQTLDLDLGSAVLGDDNLLYVLRNLRRPTVFAYDAAGNVRRKLILSPPFSKAEPFDMFVNDGRILVVYQSQTQPPPIPNRKSSSASESAKQPKEQFRMAYALYNVETGDMEVNYRPPENPGILACFANNELTFLKPTRMGRFGILELALK